MSATAETHADRSSNLRGSPSMSGLSHLSRLNDGKRATYCLQPSVPSVPKGGEYWSGCMRQGSRKYQFLASVKNRQQLTDTASMVCTAEVRRSAKGKISVRCVPVEGNDLSGAPACDRRRPRDAGHETGRRLYDRPGRTGYVVVVMPKEAIKMVGQILPLDDIPAAMLAHASHNSRTARHTPQTDVEADDITCAQCNERTRSWTSHNVP